MNYKKATKKNLKVLVCLQHFFQSLRGCGAVIGRDTARIAVDLNKAPSITLDEIKQIFSTTSLVSPNGSMAIFHNVETDGETGVLLLNISSELNNNNGIFSKYPAFNEVRVLLEGIPAMSQEQSETFAALHEAIEAQSLFNLATLLCSQQPTVDGVIIAAWIGGDGQADAMYVQGVDVADDIGNLDRVIDDPDNPDPNRPFLLIGHHGSIAQHGYTDAARLIGKKCRIYSGGRFDRVAIEPETSEYWGRVIWWEYE